MNKEDKKVRFYFQRFEWKYIITKDMANRLYNEFLSYNMCIDPFAEEMDDGAYLVNSLYFDSPTLKCYHDKIAGIKNRFKLRLRFYNTLESEDFVFLEIKKKINAVIIKERLKANSNLLKNMIWSDVCLNKRDILNDEQNIFNKFIFLEKKYSMKPVVGVRYKRKPLVGKFDKKIRITFDYDLNSYDPRMSNVIKSIDNYVIMEVKYNNTMPFWLRFIISKYNLNREAYSKYTHCLEGLPIYKIKLNKYV